MANSVSNTALVLIAVVPVVTGAVLTALLTALFTWLAQRRRDRHAHDTWLREQRFAAFTELLASMSILAPYIMARSTKGVETHLHRFIEARAKAILVAGDLTDSLNYWCDEFQNAVSPSQKFDLSELWDVVAYLRTVLEPVLTLEDVKRGFKNGLQEDRAFRSIWVEEKAAKEERESEKEAASESG